MENNHYDMDEQADGLLQRARGVVVEPGWNHRDLLRAA